MIDSTDAWSPTSAWIVHFRDDTLGAYAVDTLAGLPTADIEPARADVAIPTRSVTVSPTVGAYGPFAREGVIAIKFYVCPDGLADELMAFEQQTQSIYYPFMARVGWRYGGLCRVRSSVAVIPQPFAEVYSILARDRAHAEALDAQTKPEPPHIIDMYAACSRFAVKGSGQWIWLTQAVSPAAAMPPGARPSIP